MARGHMRQSTRPCVDRGLGEGSGTSLLPPPTSHCMAARPVLSWTLAWPAGIQTHPVKPEGPGRSLGSTPEGGLGGKGSTNAPSRGRTPGNRQESVVATDQGWVGSGPYQGAQEKGTTFFLGGATVLGVWLGPFLQHARQTGTEGNLGYPHSLLLPGARQMEVGGVGSRPEALGHVGDIARCTGWAWPANPQ